MAWEWQFTRCCEHATPTIEWRAGGHAFMHEHMLLRVASAHSVHMKMSCNRIMYTVSFWCRCRCFWVPVRCRCFWVPVPVLGCSTQKRAVPAGTPSYNRNYGTIHLRNLIRQFDCCNTRYKLFKALHALNQSEDPTIRLIGRSRLQEFGRRHPRYKYV